MFFQLLSSSARFFNAGIKPVQSNAEFGQVLGLEEESCPKLVQVRTAFGFGGIKLSEVCPSSDSFWG